MTASATGLALVPLAVAGSIPGHEIEHPMAIVILGGLITSTLLNLFVLPSLYLRFGRNGSFKVGGAAPPSAADEELWSAIRPSKRRVSRLSASPRPSERWVRRLTRHPRGRDLRGRSASPSAPAP